MKLKIGLTCLFIILCVKLCLITCHPSHKEKNDEDDYVDKHINDNNAGKSTTLSVEKFAEKMMKDTLDRLDVPRLDQNLVQAIAANNFGWSAYAAAMRKDMENKLERLEEINDCVIFLAAARKLAEDLSEKIAQNYPWILQDVKNKYKLWQIIIFFTDELPVKALLTRMQKQGMEPSVFFRNVERIHKIQNDYFHNALKLKQYSEYELDKIMKELGLTDQTEMETLKIFVLPLLKPEADKLQSLKEMDKQFLEKMAEATIFYPVLKLSSLPGTVAKIPLNKEHIKKFIKPAICDDADIEMINTSKEIAAKIKFKNVGMLVKAFYRNVCTYTYRHIMY